MTQHHFVACTHARHAQAIVDIFNEAIVTSTALYDYQPRTLQSMAPWFATKQHSNFPVIGVEDEGGTLLAFGSYGTFRAYPAFKYTVEHSVYVQSLAWGINAFDQFGVELGKQVASALLPAVRDRSVTVDDPVTAELLAQLRADARDFVVPDDGCASYRALYEGLAELESDTHLHVHKENHLLFPAVEAIGA